MSAFTPAKENALRAWVRARAEAARVHEARAIPADGDLPWRQLAAPARIVEGRVCIEGRWLAVLRTVDLRPMSRNAWFAVGQQTPVPQRRGARGVDAVGGDEVYLSARAELAGGVFALVRGRCSSKTEADVWEVVACAG